MQRTDRSTFLCLPHKGRSEKKRLQTSRVIPRFQNLVTNYEAPCTSRQATLNLVPSSRTQPIYCTFLETRSLCSEHWYSSLYHLSPPRTPSAVCDVEQHPSLEQFSTPSFPFRWTRLTIFLPPSKNMLVIIRSTAVSLKPRKSKIRGSQESIHLLVPELTDERSPRNTVLHEKLRCLLFERVWNLVSHINGRTYAEGVREVAAEEDIWPKSEEVKTDWRKLFNYCQHR